MVGVNFMKSKKLSILELKMMLEIVREGKAIEKACEINKLKDKEKDISGDN